MFEYNFSVSAPQTSVLPGWAMIRIPGKLSSDFAEGNPVTLD
jgi:hypothetical protein